MSVFRRMAMIKAFCFVFFLRVSYLAAVQTLVENDTHRPDVHLVGDFGGFLSDHKALRGQVPDGGERGAMLVIPQRASHETV